MNTQQLKCVIDEDKCLRRIVLGVYSSDTLPSKITSYPTAIIFNTDPKYLPGEHWIVTYYENPHQCEFYDSFGRHPIIFDKYISKAFKDCSFNSIKVQKFGYDTCGYHVLYYLIVKCKGISINQIVNILKTQHDSDLYVFETVRNYFKCDL